VTPGEKNINPAFKKSPFKVYSQEECIEGLKTQQAPIVI